MRFLSRLLISCCCAVLIILGSCRKTDVLKNGGALTFSADTLLFDTVFTTLGSATYKIKIYNAQNQPVHLSSIRLGKANASPFKINVNGFPGGVLNEVKDQDLAAHDSLYVFSIVTIDPNSETAPFVVEDQLIATLNGKDFSVPVIAYGQNAHYLYDSILPATATVWDNTLPYVIIHSAYIEPAKSLTILPGTRIYMHADSRLWVEGSLITQGTKTDSVIFQGDRLDRSYFSYLELPGEWGGIYFTNTSSGNKLSWTTIKNGGSATLAPNGQVTIAAAVQVDGNPLTGSEQVQIDNCVIQNCIGYGLFAYGGGVQMRNSMIHTCGSQNLGIFQGGNYEFDHCTIATYGTQFVSHAQNPVFSALNYLDTSNTGFIPGNLKAVFTNTIIYGPMTEEVICNKKDGASYDVSFVNCLLRYTDGIHPDTKLSNCKQNTDPLFADYAKWDFHLKEGSPANDAGNNLLFGQTLDDLPRNNNIGAY